MANVYPAKVGRTINYKTTISGVVKWRPAVITGGIPAPITVTASSRTGGVVSLTATNTIATNTNIVVSLTEASYNGVFSISARSGTSVSFIQNMPDDADGGTGTIQNADVANARVGHHGETYTAIVRRGGGDMHWEQTPPSTRTDLNKWRPG